MGFPHYRYVTFSYSALLTERDNGRFRDLVASEDYQALYGDTVQLRNKTTLRVVNTATGWKLASSVGGVGTGERGQRCIVDDGNNVKDAESQVVRDETTRWFRESLSTRFGDIRSGARINIQQRVHAEDITGAIMELGLPYTYLTIAMRYEPFRQTAGEPNEIGWIDPRHRDDPDKCEGVLAWPERFPEEAVNRLEKELGPYAFAGQLQQLPAPRGGGILKKEYWQLLEPLPGNKFPPTSARICSVDGAFTLKETGDYSAFTVWGIFTDLKTRRNRACLMSAWRGRVPLHGEYVPRLEHETKYPGDSPEVMKHKDAIYRARAQVKFGLVERIRAECLRLDVDRLLIESKGPGMSVAQELQRLYSNDGIMIEMVNPRGDKTARVHSCVPLFSNELVYAPDKSWADLVIDESLIYPRGAHDDLLDTVTQALLWYRQQGILRMSDEYVADEQAGATHRRRLRGLYGMEAGSYLPPLG